MRDDRRIQKLLVNSMRIGGWIELLLVTVGLAVLASVLATIDLGQVASLMARVGWGFLLVLFVAGLMFTADTCSWFAMLKGFAVNLRSLCALWRVRLVGEMLNIVTPTAGVGGEPAKALILVKSLAVEPREAVASVLAAKTTILLAFIPFFATAIVLMCTTPQLPRGWIFACGIAFAIYIVAIGAFFLVQRYKIASWFAARLHPFRCAARLERVLNEVRAVDQELERLYVRAPGRVWVSLVFAFLGWLLGVAELYVISALLGYPLSISEVWIIEAVAQLVRQATGFIPGSLGVTEGSMLLLYSIFTATPTVGVAVALVRRLREAVFIAGGIGFGLGYLHTYRSRFDEETAILDPCNKARP